VGPTFLRNQIKDWSERTEDGQSVDAVVKQLFAKTASMKDAKILFFTPPSIREGTTDGFELKLKTKEMTIGKR
jgi:HAE1 family hydrophobic/amphiphilic exporter-1